MNRLITILNDIANDEFKNHDGVLLTNDARWHQLMVVVQQIQRDHSLDETIARDRAEIANTSR